MRIAILLIVTIGVLFLGGCGDKFCPWDGPESCVAPVGAGGSTVVPCGVDVCSDGEGGQLQDVGQACAGDDMTEAPNGGLVCCYGLTCVGWTAGTMGECLRTNPAVTAECPVSTDGGTGSMWLYQCVGTYSTGSGDSITRPGTFTGPPPSEVSAQGGLGAWMKIKFSAAHPTVTVAGMTWALLSAKQCQPLGPLPAM